MPFLCTCVPMQRVRLEHRSFWIGCDDSQACEASMVGTYNFMTRWTKCIRWSQSQSLQTKCPTSPPPRVARVLRQFLDQRPVRIRLRPIRQIERIFQPRAQMPAQLGHALVHGPDLAAADDGGLPGGILDF